MFGQFPVLYYSIIVTMILVKLEKTKIDSAKGDPVVKNIPL
jgi:hypothetical protein